jgi:hypothetical protein
VQMEGRFPAHSQNSSHTPLLLTGMAEQKKNCDLFYFAIRTQNFAIRQSLCFYCHGRVESCSELGEGRGGTDPS